MPLLSLHRLLPLPLPHTRPERLIDLIINRDYWEIIDVQTIIVMSISYKEIPSETRLYDAKYNV